MEQSKELMTTRSQTIMPMDFSQMNVLDVAKLLAQSGYFKEVRDMAQAVAKILAGQEIGIGPIASLTNVYIQSGRPCYSANIIAAIIKRSGVYNYKIQELTDTKCVLEFYEHGKALTPLSTFTIEDAKKADLLTGANAHSWRHYPRNMLFARALTNGQKWHCPDVAGGLPLYTPEELGARVDREGSVIPEEGQMPPFGSVPSSSSGKQSPTSTSGETMNPEATTTIEAYTFHPDTPYTGEIVRLIPVTTITNPETMKTKRKPGVIAIETEHGVVSAFFYERPPCLKENEDWESLLGCQGTLSFVEKQDTAKTGVFWYVKEFTLPTPPELEALAQDQPGDALEPEEDPAAWALAYIQSIQDLCELTDKAIMEAMAELPEDILMEHWIAAKHGPNAWNAVYHRHQCHAVDFPDRLLAVLALKQLVECKAGLTGILQEFALIGTLPNLTLGKMRR